MHGPDRRHDLFEAGAPDQRLGPILRLRVEVVLVEREHLAAAHEDFAVDNDSVGAAPVRAINQVGNGIVNGLPFRPHDVEERDVGLLLHLQRAEIRVPLHAARTIDGEHLDRGLGTKHLGIKARFMQAADDEEGLPYRIEIVARHGRIRAKIPARSTWDRPARAARFTPSWTPMACLCDSGSRARIQSASYRGAVSNIDSRSVEYWPTRPCRLTSAAWLARFGGANVIAFFASCSVGEARSS